MSTENERHDQVDHVDERWLSSYAHTMMLFLGLFVILYSLAMEHQGDINSQLQEISEEKFTDQVNTELLAQNDPKKLKQEIDKLELNIAKISSTLNETDSKWRQAENKNQTLLRQLEVMEPLIKERQLLNEKIQTLMSAKANKKERVIERELASRRALVLETKAQELEVKSRQLQNKADVFEARALASELKVRSLETKMRDLESLLLQSQPEQQPK
jgi:predicted ribosome quality control (RQC) complex YloA/Tae2 family protein